MASQTAILRRSKEYLEALSRGMDPIGNKPVPAGDVAAQERLRKCFAYVAGYLQEALEAAPSLEEAPPLKEAPAGEASETEEVPEPEEAEAARLLAEAGFPGCMRIAEETLSLQAVRKEIRQCLRTAGLRDPNVSAWHEWLVQEGILRRPEEEKGPWPVTERGRSLGFLQAAECPEGDITWTLCRPEAQRFLAENLPAIYRKERVQMDQLAALLRPEALDQLTYSETPVGIRELVTMFNRLIPQELPKVNVSLLSNWLKKEGYLEESFRGRDTVIRVVSERGQKIGIGTREDRKQTPVYDKAAQQYLARCLPGIMAGLRAVRLSAEEPKLTIPEGVEVPVSSTPLGLSRFSALVDKSLTDCGGTPLTAGAIRTWLIREGYMERKRVGAEKRALYIPNEEGEAIGLTYEEAGDPVYTVLTESAQRFIAAHLAEIAAIC